MNNIPFIIFSHTQQVSDTSDHPVSVGSGGVNFFLFFRLLLSSSAQISASNFVWMFLGWTSTKFVKTGVLPLFFKELWVILCNFWPI